MKCNLCGAAAITMDQNHIGYMEGKNFEIYYCNSCDTQFVKPVEFSTEIYQAIYLNAETTPGYNRYFYYSNSIKDHHDPLKFLASLEPMYWSVQEFLNIHGTDDAKILEVGSGFGYLTYALCQKGYNAKGLEIAASAVQGAQEKFGDLYVCADVFEYYKTHKMEYDIIILTEVIEHLEEPVAFISVLLEMLKPNGKILITTPNKSVYGTSTIWESDLPPIHLWWFSEKSAEYIASQLNCEIGFVDFSSFNRHNFIKPRYSFLKKNNEDTPRLNHDGTVANPQVWSTPQNIGPLKATAQKIFTTIATLPFLDKVLAKAEFPLHKSTTMAFVLQKRN